MFKKVCEAHAACKDVCTKAFSLYSVSVHFAKGQVHQKGKSPSKVAAILRATKQKRTKKQKRKKLRYKHLDKRVSTMSSNILIVSLLHCC